MKTIPSVMTIMLATLFNITTAFAGSTYPDKPVSVIIGFSPGGPTDAIGRVLFRKMAGVIKTPFVIENRPGAGGNIGSQDLARAKPDGYTIMYGTSSVTTAPPLFKRDDLNPEQAFDAISCTTKVPLILLVNNKVPADNVNQFYKLIKDNPGKYFMGSSGNGAIDHLVAMEVASKLGQQFQHVPYKGNGPALTDLAAGNVNFMYSGSFNSALPFIQKGTIKALAVTSEKRSGALPQVPTLSENVLELKGYDAGTWQALLAPKHTPSAVLNALDHAVQTALKDEEVLKNLHYQGADIMHMSAAECQAFIKNEYTRWSKTINDLNLSAK